MHQVPDCWQRRCGGMCHRKAAAFALLARLTKCLWSAEVSGMEKLLLSTCQRR